MTAGLAEQVWIAAALLHREHSEREDFSVREILERARAVAAPRPVPPGLQTHVYKHCVANLRPDPGTHRYLVATARGRRRLYRPGDPYDPRRARGRARPLALPPRYGALLPWYERWCAAQAPAAPRPDPLLALKGAAAKLWGGRDPDAYVRQLRAGWK